MLTDEGRRGLAQLLASSLEGGQIEVSDGSLSVRVAISDVQVREMAVVAHSADIGPGDGEFEWKRQSLVSPAGDVIDSTEVDMGRKGPDSVWAFDYIVDFAEAS